MKDPRLYLEHILEAITRIETYTREGRAAFMQSTLIQDAVVRNFEIIGEATKRLRKSYANNIPLCHGAKSAVFGMCSFMLIIVWIGMKCGLPSSVPPLSNNKSNISTKR